MSKWISVDERLPEKSGYYLICFNDQTRGKQNGIDLHYFQHKAKNWKGTYNPSVSHWCEPPEPPSEGIKEDDTKKIIDVCCGGRMFYFDKKDERVLFQDIRQVNTTLCDGRSFEVSPDIIADFTNQHHKDNSFKLVVFDPPHLTSESRGYQKIKYGHLDKDWKDVITKGFKECFRILEPNGILIFKWNETNIKTREILNLVEEKPIFGHRSGKRSNTHWICFMKGK